MNKHQPLEQAISKEQKKVQLLTGKLKPQKGHKVFRKHKITGEVSIAPLEFQVVDFNQYKKNNIVQLKGKITDKGEYTYGTFLNLKNAKIKLK
jgi:hypothetical protein